MVVLVGKKQGPEPRSAGGHSCRCRTSQLYMRSGLTPQYPAQKCFQKELCPNATMTVSGRSYSQRLKAAMRFCAKRGEWARWAQS